MIIVHPSGGTDKLAVVLFQHDWFSSTKQQLVIVNNSVYIIVLYYYLDHLFNCSNIIKIIYSMVWFVIIYQNITLD